MTTGHFTTDGQGCLTDESVLTVDGRNYPIPVRTERAGVIATHRLVDTIRAAGYRLPAANVRDAMGEFDGRGHAIKLIPAEEPAS